MLAVLVGGAACGFGVMTNPDTFDLAALKAELTTDEGRKHYPYNDTEGNLSGGIGRNLSAVGFSDAEIDFMFANDVADSCEDLDAHAPWWRGLPPDKQRVMINLTFNMGWPKFSQFVYTLAALRANDWEAAAENLRASKWWRQVGERGPRMVARLLANRPIA